ncbi:MAG: DUF4145 domain-containing protein [Bacteroidales bacterium]|nr:DUF4145 domain-containing protein [Bacteroidales bacterium]
MRQFFKNNGFDYEILFPNICPHCHITINPAFAWKRFSNDTDGTENLFIAFICTNIDCQKLFLAHYRLKENEFLFSRYLNGLPKGPDWPIPIQELYDGSVEPTEDDKEPPNSKFIKTYLQSLEAENFGLDELAGMGYRKAIEYLVKDWAIKNNPEDREAIVTLPLAQVIAKYYSGDLKDMLDRATWLGNDQTHYIKIFEQFDTDILKELIAVIMVELDNEYKKAHFKESIKKYNGK